MNGYIEVERVDNGWSLRARADGRTPGVHEGVTRLVFPDPTWNEKAGALERQAESLITALQAGGQALLGPRVCFNGWVEPEAIPTEEPALRVNDEELTGMTPGPADA